MYKWKRFAYNWIHTMKHMRMTKQHNTTIHKCCVAESRSMGTNDQMDKIELVNFVVVRFLARLLLSQVALVDFNINSLETWSIVF